MNHSIDVHLGANIDKYKAGMDAAKKMGSDSLGFIASIFDKIKSMFSGMWDSFKSMFSGIGDKFKSMFGSMSDSASGAFSKIAGYFKGSHSDIDATGDKMEKTDEKSAGLAKTIGITLVAAFVAVTAAAGVMVKQGLAVDSMYAGIATSSGIAVSQISRFEGAAVRSGVSVKDLGSSMSKFQDAMAKAAAGDGSDTFTKLGVKVADSNNVLLKTDDVLVDVSKKIAGMSTEAEKYAAAAKLGFDGNPQMLEDIAHAGALVARVSDDQAAATVRLGKIWHEILPAGQSMWSEISDKLTNSLTPAMTSASVTILESKNRIVDAFSQIYGGGSILDKLGEKIRGWSSDAAKWFGSVEKSTTDMTISVMKFIAAKTGLGNADAFKPNGAGYVPAQTPLTGDSKTPVVTDAQKAANQQLDQTTKSLADRIAVMKEQIKVGATLTEGQRTLLQLDGAQLAQSPAKLAAAKADAASLDALEKQFKSMQDAKAADQAASKKEAEAYATVTASIQGKIDENNLQLLSNDALSESQKLAIKLDAEIASGKLKLTPAHLAVTQAKLAELAATEQLVKAQQAEKDVNAWLQQSAQARNASSAALEVEYSMYGKSNDARDIAMVAVKAETDLEKYLSDERKKGIDISEIQEAQLRAEKDMRVEVEQATMAQAKALQYAAQLSDENSKFSIDYTVDDKQRAAAQLALDSDVWRQRIQNAGDGTEAQQRLQQQYDTWYKNQSIKPALDEQKQMWGSIENTAHDTFVSIFDSGKSAFDRLRDALKNGLLDLLYQMTLKKWIIQVQAQTSSSLLGAAANPGDPGAAATSLASASSNPLISAVGMASTAYKTISTGVAGLGTSLVSSLGSGLATLGNTFGSTALTAFGQGMAGIQLPASLAQAGALNAGAAAGTTLASGATILGGAAIGLLGGKLISGQYGSNATVAGGTAAGAAAGTFLFPGLGTALGAAIGGVLGGVANRLFGMGDTKVKSQGLSGTYDGSTVTGNTYQNLHQDGGLFRSDKDWKTTTALTTEMQSQLTQAFGAIKNSASVAATTLGVSSTALDTYSKTFDITLTGDKTKDQQAITDFFAGVSDDVSKMLVPNLASFSQAGETATATLTRLVGEFAATTTAAQNLGKTATEMFGSDGMSSAGARDRLVQAAGGTDALTSLTSAFSQSFLTDAERLVPVSKALDAALGGLDLSVIPKTDAQFKALVQSINPVDEASSKLLVSLLQLAPAFAQVHPDNSAETKQLKDQLDELVMSPLQLVQKARAAISDENKDLFDQVQTAQAAKDAIATHNSVLEVQAQIYDLTGDKASAAAVLEEQHAIALKALDPALRESTEKLWGLQAAAAATATNNSLLDLQSQIAALTGDKTAAAAILLAQHKAALIALDPALRDTTQNLWDLQAAATAAADAKTKAASLVTDAENMFTALQNGTKKITDDLTKRITAEQALSDAVKSTLASMTTSTTTLTDRAAAQAQIKAAVVAAKAGNMPTADSLKDAFSTVSKDASDQFASYADYLKDLYSTKNDLGALGNLADKSLSTDKLQLNALNDMLTAAQKQLDVLKGIDTTGLSIEQLFAGFQSSVAVAGANPVNAATSAIGAAYQSSLGRAPDAAGLAYWQQQAAGGASLSDIKASIDTSAEAKVQQLYQTLLGRPADGAGLAYYMGTGESVAQIKADIMASNEYKAHQHALGVPGFANGGDFAGGVRMVGEVGPEIEATGASRIHSTQSLMNALRSPSDNSAALLAEVKALREDGQALREEVAKLRETNSAENSAIARYTLNTADHLDAAVNGDTPLATKVIPA